MPPLSDYVFRVLGLARAAWASLDRLAARLDPNDDPDAEPLGALPLLVILAAIVWSAYMFLRWKYQPMQDLGHHVAMAAVVADYGRPGSLYTPLYDPIDHFAANSLLYQVAGRIGRFIGVMNAVRGCMVLYLAGVPLANVYALRVFGRSAWPALLAVPLVYNMNYVAGFANMLFAAPLMVLALPALYLALVAPSRKRVAGAAVVFALLFLGHAHLFLWTGALSFLMTFCFFVHALAGAAPLRARLRRAGLVVLAALASVTPALLMFAHWYSRTFGAGRAQGAVLNATAGAAEHFGAYFKTPRDSFNTFADAFNTLTGDRSLDGLIRVFVVVGIAIALTRLHRFRRPPVLELAFVITGLSYFFLPEGLKGHDILASRQPSVALWLLPAMASPVPARVSMGARAIIVALLGALTWSQLAIWYENLKKFESEEAVGLAYVMEAAPPRQRLHYVKIDPNSAYFGWRPWWHIEKLYMGDKLGQTADTPGILSTSAIRYREGAQIHRVDRHWSDWQNDTEIWQNFDLVLLRRWNPTPAQRAAAEKHGELLRKWRDWELWKSKEAIPPPN